jgi:hypothetical protein
MWKRIRRIRAYSADATINTLILPEKTVLLCRYLGDYRFDDFQFRCAICGCDTPDDGCLTGGLGSCNKAYRSDSRNVIFRKIRKY